MVKSSRPTIHHNIIRTSYFQISQENKTIPTLTRPHTKQSQVLYNRQHKAEMAPSSVSFVLETGCNHNQPRASVSYSPEKNDLVKIRDSSANPGRRGRQTLIEITFFSVTLPLSK